MADLLNEGEDSRKRTRVFVNHVDLYTGKNISKVRNSPIAGRTVIRSLSFLRSLDSKHNLSFYNSDLFSQFYFD